MRGTFLTDQHPCSVKEISVPMLRKCTPTDRKQDFLSSSAEWVAVKRSEPVKTFDPSSPYMSRIVPTLLKPST